MSYRVSQDKDDAVAVVVLDLKGRTKRVFRGAYAMMWSPDAKRILIWTHTGKRIYEGEKTSELAVKLISTVWLDNQTIAGFPTLREDKPEADPYWNKLHLLNAHGSLKKTVALKWSATALRKLQVDESQLEEGSPYPIMLLPRPSSQRTFCAAYDTTEPHVSYFVLVDSHTGQLTPLVTGKSLEWAPDGQRFCTVSGQELAAYDKNRQVSTARLWIGTGTSGKFKNIVSGLVHVDSADWRGANR